MNFAFAGAVSGLIAVALGAFAAHGLKSKLAPEMLAVFETGARYQMYHAFALLAAAWAAGQGAAASPAFARAAGWCFLAGTLLFSGSLYALALTGLRKLGIVTPFGGVFFLAGWGLLAFSFLARR
ncbi:MAG: DUF423 domain-containing protein [bacterium]|nr:DUF423 domain-containing protein [bacterium]